MVKEMKLEKEPVALFSIPAIYDDKYFEAVASMTRKYKCSRVHEVYGSFPQDIIGNLRPPFAVLDVDRKKMKEYILFLHEHQIHFNYVLNSTITTGLEYSEAGKKKILSFIGNLLEMGVDSFTISSPYLVSTIHSEFSDVKLTASICCKIMSPRKAVEFEDIGVDEIVLDRDINRRFDIIKSIRNAVKTKIKLLCNTPCLLQCINQTYHDNLSSLLTNSLMGATCKIDPKIPFEPYCSSYCREKKERQPVEWIKSPWIRPEDINIYQNMGIDEFKIDGRDRNAEYVEEVIDAYLRQYYEGNFFHLIREKIPRINSDFKCANYIPYVNNRKLDSFLDPFVSGRVICDYYCDMCGYCNDFLAN